MPRATRCRWHGAACPRARCRTRRRAPPAAPRRPRLRRPPAPRRPRLRVTASTDAGALQKRRAHQERLMARGIGRGLLQLAEPALLEPLLVGHRLLLHVFDVERPSPALVGVEVAFAGKQVGEIPGFVDAAVQPQAADRVVDVRRVAAEKDPALAELLRDALM